MIGISVLALVRRPVAAGVVALLVLASGCATLEWDAPRIASHAIADGDQTTLGKAFATRQNAHIGQSGFDVLTSGSRALHARAALADAAEHTLDVQYYSVAQDASTDLLLERIVAARRRGVRVRMLLDDIEPSTRAFAARALSLEPTIQVRLFHPFLNRRLFGFGKLLEFLIDNERLNRRMHNKLWLADNVVAIFGSRNLGDAYFDANGSANFSDVDLLAIGPVVPDLSGAFDDYWNSASAVPFAPAAATRPATGEPPRSSYAGYPSIGCRPSLTDPYLDKLASGVLSLSWGQAKVAYDKPDAAKQVARHGIEHGMPDVSEPAATNAELLLVSPYFIPSPEGLRHLGDMSRSGVRIAVLTNSLASTDVPAAHMGYARYRTELLRRGVELFELRPEPGEPHQTPHLWPLASATSLHAKVIVVDRTRSVVGSLNQDPRSRLYNTESWVSIESPELAAQLAGLFQESTQAHHAFRVVLRGNTLEWRTVEAGRPITYESDPLALPWKRFLSRVMSWIVPEDLL